MSSVLLYQIGQIKKESNSWNPLDLSDKQAHDVCVR